MKLKLAHIIFIFLFVGFQGISQTPKFYATTDAREITTNTFFKVSFVLENMRGRNFNAPDFGELTVVSGPSTSNEMQIINGRTTSKMSYVFGLTAKKPGIFRIGPASVNVNNKKYNSKTLTIKVVQGKVVSEIAEEEQAFFQMEASDTIGFIGQQIRLDYVMYATKDVRPQSFQSESSYDGFFATNVRDFSARSERVIINNIQYTRKVIRTVALFPQQTGTFEISPATIRAAVPIDGAKPRGLFFGPPSERKYFQTGDISIQIKSLPEPIPSSFSGAIGKFEMQCRLSGNRMKVGDAVTLSIYVSGNGDAKLVAPPQLEEIPGLDYFEPNLISDKVVENSGTIVSTKTWEYLIVAEETGRFRLNPTFSYFNPDSSRFETIYRGPFDLIAGKGNSSSSSNADKLDEVEISLDPIYLTGNWTVRNSSFFKSRAYWSLIIFAFILLLATLIYRHYIRKQEGRDLKDIKALKAEKVAIKRLKTAEGFMQNQEERAFYDEVSKTMLTYISDKLRMPASEISKTNVEVKMKQLKLPAELIKSFLSILHSCELALFARKPDGGMKALYDETVQSIAQVESYLVK
jgi:hypothetical protein